MNYPATLPLAVQSPDDLSAVLMDLAAYRGSMSSVPIGGPALAMLVGWNVDPVDGPAIDDVINHLQVLSRKVPTVTVSLGAVDTHAAEQLVHWFRQHTHPQCLVTTVLDTTMGGGFRLRAGSKIYDYSFKQRLLANRRTIRTMLGWTNV